jgi:hypothetical protein
MKVRLIFKRCAQIGPDEWGTQHYTVDIELPTHEARRLSGLINAPHYPWGQPTGVHIVTPEST